MTAPRAPGEAGGAGAVGGGETVCEIRRTQAIPAPATGGTISTAGFRFVSHNFELS